MITSFHSKYMTSGYHHGRLITSWRERDYRICRLWVSRQKCLKYVIIHCSRPSCSLKNMLDSVWSKQITLISFEITREYYLEQICYRISIQTSLHTKLAMRANANEGQRHEQPTHPSRVDQQYLVLHNIIHLLQLNMHCRKRIRKVDFSHTEICFFLVCCPRNKYNTCRTAYFNAPFK